MEGNQGNVPWPPYPVPPQIQQGAFYYFYPFYMGPTGAPIPLPPGAVRDFYGQASGERLVRDFGGQTTGERAVQDFGGQTSGERSVRDFGVQTTGERSVRDFGVQTTGERSVRDFGVQTTGERSVRDFCSQTTGERSVRDFCGQTSIEVETLDVSTQTSFHEVVSSGEDLAPQRPPIKHLGSTTEENCFAVMQNGRPWSLTPDPEDSSDGNVEADDLHGPWHYESGIFGEHVDREPIREAFRVVRQEDGVTETKVDELLSCRPDQQQGSAPRVLGEPPVDTGNHSVIHEPDELTPPIETANAVEAFPDPSPAQRPTTTMRSLFDIDFHGPFRYECGTSRFFIAGRIRMEQGPSPFDAPPTKRPRTEIPSSAAELEEDVMVEIWSGIQGKKPTKQLFLKRVTADMLEDALCDLNIKRDPKKLQTRKRPRRRRSARK